MTELEKSRRGYHDAVDLNRLAEEVATKNIDFLKACRDAIKADGMDGLDNVEIGAPAMDVLVALNTFVCRIGIKEPLVAHIAAALRHQSEVVLLVSANEKVNRDMAEEIAENFFECLTTYNMKVSDEREKRPEN